MAGLAHVPRDLFHHLRPSFRRSLLVTVARHFRHRSRVEFDQQRLFPFRQDAGSHGRNVGCRQREQLLEDFRRPHFAGEGEDHFFVVRITTEGRVRHEEMPVHEKAERPRFLLVESQPNGDLLRQPLSDVAVILLLPFPQVMHQHRQVEDVLAFDATVDLAEHAGVLSKRFGAADGQQAVLIHGVLMVLIELHQPAHGAHRRHELLQ